MGKTISKAVPKTLGHNSGCGCSACMGGNTEGKQVEAGLGNGVAVGSPTSVATKEQFANYLTSGFWNDAYGVTGLKFAGWNKSALTFSISNYFSAGEKAGIRDALSQWSEVTKVTFTEQTSGGNITFGGPATASEQGRAFSANNWSYQNNAYRVTSSRIVIDYDSGGFGSDPTDLGNYALMTAIHEIGHALGLGHSGFYNAGSGTPTYANNANWLNDTRQYSLMSYWNANNSGASHQGEYASTPLLMDIYAIQQIYGANTSTRSGNTVYGFNNNSGSDQFDFTVNVRPVVAIWDGAGTDTLDVSGYAMAQIIRLTDGEFSNIGGSTGNVVIAYGAVIENAVGGAGNDSLYGNSANNILRGGLGDDTFYGTSGDDTVNGEGGSDTVVYSFNIGSFLLAIVDSVTISVQNIAQAWTDTVINVENFVFDGAAYTLGQIQTLLAPPPPPPPPPVVIEPPTVIVEPPPVVVEPPPVVVVPPPVVVVPPPVVEPPPPPVVEPPPPVVVAPPPPAPPPPPPPVTVDQYLLTFKQGTASYGYTTASMPGTDTITAAELGYGAASGDIALVNRTNSAVELTIVNTSAPSAVVINGLAGADTVIVNSISTAFSVGLDGKDGDDVLTINGPSGANILRGGAGSDVLTSSAGTDTMYGEDGNDTLRSGDGADTLYGGNGFDSLEGGAGADRLYGGADNDTLSGGSENDILSGDEGDDTLYGETGNDNLYGANGSDTLYGDEGSDQIYGGYGDDVLYGGAGNDGLRGDGGNDTLFGGAGADTLYGFDQNDILVGGAAADTLWGGAGADVFKWSAEDMDGSFNTLRDYSKTQGDKLDIRDILFGYEDGVSDIAKFVTFSAPNSVREVSLFVDRDGAGSAYAMELIAKISNPGTLNAVSLEDSGLLIL